VLLCIALISTSALPAQGDEKYPYSITVRGGNEASFTPGENATVVGDRGLYDAIIVGGGLAGLAAAVYLTDHKKHVLLLEKEDVVGGLASGGADRRGVHFDRGAAYWTDTYEEEQKILDHIGLGNFHKKYPIHEPADSFLWNGEFYPGIWEEETMAKLPASFTVFYTMLKKADEKKQIPNQPMEEAKDLSLDEISAADWVRSMPALLREEVGRGDAKAKALNDRFEADPKVNRDDPMADVIGLLDLYCRSALGTTADQVSAVAFANFYISEIVTRYTTPDGTAGAAERMAAMLKKRKKLAFVKTLAAVTRIHSFDDHVVVSYNKDGVRHEAAGKTAIFSAQLKLAPKLIDDFKGTEQANLMEELGYAHYSVHNVFVEGHPFRATYDTWVRAKDYSPTDFTDVILGRWMDPKIKGYEGYRKLKATPGPDGLASFAKNPRDDDGILSIYHPLPLDEVGKGYGDDEARELAFKAVNRLLEMWPPVEDGHKLGSKVVVKSVLTNRWPFSVHIARPGHFKRAKVMRRPFKRVVFGNNNLGTPAFEEALFRGHCAADHVLELLDSRFKYEKWTQCPRD
jgi:protoporphyrinogen oxidase